MSVYSWVMRSPYGRIFAQNKQPTITDKARHGDIWISPLGMYYFSRSATQVGNPGTGVWVAVAQQQAIAPLVMRATPLPAGAGNTVLSGTLQIDIAAGVATGGSVVVTGLNSRIIAGTPVTVAILETTGTLTQMTAIGTNPGEITFTITAVGGALAAGTTATIAFSANPV